jgi:hypothetical protein
VGKVKIRYYVVRSAWQNSRTWGYWVPTKPMKAKAKGFAMICCGEDGAAAWAIAERCNTRWDAFRRGEKVADPAAPPARAYPPGSFGEAFASFRATGTWAEKKPKTRDEWHRGWKRIDPVFGDVAPATVSMQDLDTWYAALLATVGVREAHRAMKIWRALWRVAGTLKTDAGAKYCERDADPSLSIRVKTPSPRSAIWAEGEAVRLVKRAIRMGYGGLAAALAVAWDTMLSPVDVRSLTLAQLKDDGEGQVFSLARAKTGKAAIGTLGVRARRVLDAYITSLPFALHPDLPIFHTRGWEGGPRRGRQWTPRPYNADMMGEDFRLVREAEFPGDTRKVMDFRRSGAIEAAAGEVDATALAGKMANTIDTSRELQNTYLPKNAAVVRLADAARTRGRGRMRNTKGPKS